MIGISLTMSCWYDSRNFDEGLGVHPEDAQELNVVVDQLFDQR